jgi:hypothetical protein
LERQIYRAHKTKKYQQASSMVEIPPPPQVSKGFREK